MIVKRIYSLFLIIFIAVSTAFAQDTLENRIRSILSPALDDDGPGFSVSILKDGEVMVEKTFGYANLDERELVTTDTKFNLGTLSGQFTAMGIMILKDDGKLQYKDKVSQYIEGLPEYAMGITIKHLLEESTGFPYLDIRAKDLKYNTPEKVVDFLNTKDKLMFSTGKKAMVNPVNTALQVLILEKVSGTDYRSFITDRIFTPMNMDQSEVFKGGLFYKVKDKALGYQNVGQQGNSEYEKVDKQLEKEYMKGVTGIYCSTKDMQTWFRAWNSDTIIQSGTLSGAMRLNFIRGAKEFYGYGWRKAFNRGQKYLYQGGIGYGNTHVLLMIPQEKIQVMILANQRSVFGLRKRAFELVNLVSKTKFKIE